MNKQDEQELRTNKQELISKYELIKNSYNFKVVATDGIISDLKRLDEPEKVTIPQFVADWIEECKAKGKSLLRALLYTPEKVNSWVDNSDNQELFARAWLDGYDIQGRKYVVTDGNHLYFKNYQEDIEIVILADEQAGTMDYVKKFDTKEEAQKAADILGWKVQEVE